MGCSMTVCTIIIAASTINTCLGIANPHIKV
jgi:hypothetical protein